jgi:hypothetical protein
MSMDFFECCVMRYKQGQTLRVSLARTGKQTLSEAECVQDGCSRKWFKSDILHSSYIGLMGVSCFLLQHLYRFPRSVRRSYALSHSRLCGLDARGIRSACLLESCSERSWRHPGWVLSQHPTFGRNAVQPTPSERPRLRLG